MKIMGKFIVSLLFIILQVTVVTSQENEKADIAVYKEASEIGRKAQKVLKNDLIEGEKLFYQSLKVYPIIYYMNMLAYKKAEIGDLRGANKVWDDFITACSERQNIVCYDPSRSSSIIIKYTNYSSSKFISDARNAKAGANFYKGDITLVLKELLLIKSTTGFTYKEWDFLGEVAIQVSRFDLAQESVDELNKFYSTNKSQEMGYATQLSPLYLSGKLALAKMDYSAALSLGEELEKNDTSLFNSWKGRAEIIKSEAHLGLGNIEKAKYFYESAIKHAYYSRTSPDIAYLGGLIALAEKDYTAALERFTTNLSFKPGYLRPGYVYAQQKTYTKKAEAYLGLKDFLNAKKVMKLR